MISSQRYELAKSLIKEIQPGRYYTIYLDEAWYESPDPYVYKSHVAQIRIQPVDRPKVQIPDIQYNQMGIVELSQSALKEIVWRIRHRAMIFGRQLRGIIGVNNA
jgi:hypothetical protein